MCVRQEYRCTGKVLLPSIPRSAVPGCVPSLSGLCPDFLVYASLALLALLFHYLGLFRCCVVNEFLSPFIKLLVSLKEV